MEESLAEVMARKVLCQYRAYHNRKSPAHMYDPFSAERAFLRPSAAQWEQVSGIFAEGMKKYGVTSEAFSKAV